MIGGWLWGLIDHAARAAEFVHGRQPCHGFSESAFVRRRLVLGIGGGFFRFARLALARILFFLLLFLGELALSLFE